MVTDHGKKHNSKKTVTLRIDNETLTKLLEEAGQKRVNLSILGNRIFKDHVDFHSRAIQAQLIYLPKQLLVKMMDSIPDKMIEDIARYVVENVMKGTIISMRGKYSFEEQLSTLDSWLSVSGFPYEHKKDGNKHVYTIQHQMGRKWSLYFESGFSLMFKEFVRGNPRIMSTNNAVVFELKLKE